MTFLFITLKVQDIHYLFFQKVFLSHFFAILYFEVPMWSHPKVTIPSKVAIEEGC